MLKRILAGVVLAAALLIAQTTPQTPSKPASPLNTAVLEAYVRHLLIWTASVDVTISDPVPAPMPGYYAVKVRGSLGGASRRKRKLLRFRRYAKHHSRRSLQREHQSV